MAETARSQFFHRVEPVFLWRSLRTASGLPEFLREGGDVLMPECGGAMANRSRLRLPMSFFGVLQRLPRMLLPRQVILFSMLFANTMGVGGAVL